MRTIGLAIVMHLLLAGVAFAFSDNSNGTITDGRTGLVWQKQDDGATKTWENAITYCEGLTLGGQTDWRLPNVKELKTIVDNSKTGPAINTTYFPNTHSSRCWSSSTYADGTDYAWSVSFYHGGVGSLNKTYSFYVRCVRGGQ